MLSTNKTTNKRPPILVVVMGVSGCGKTTLAKAIAEHYDFTFLDADSLHSEQAKKQMSQGVPLTDEQRMPWIARICQQLELLQRNNKSCVLAYSGLKQPHRQLIFDVYHHSLGILLNAEAALIASRLSGRENHFMSPQLLASQIAAMEPINKHSAENINLLTLNAENSLADLLAKSVDFIT